MAFAFQGQGKYSNNGTRAEVGLGGREQEGGRWNGRWKGGRPGRDGTGG